ncbi:lipid-A-disaccharide synthase [Azorhizobium oxalatiphilum]|uniref:Lipid-A-disaccharide synthase n=1 Tax=Azorhizobium oxalatiphilum TaxID=980631 RepID=A0A917CCD6_9HYPH|nr:lipid-A-disaccharide synthase [Azorhizobium oxalatiphilum]GGF83927.1 lipid-A-disaccharide synthase [Azorhizobium oxalatiphilum]
MIVPAGRPLDVFIVAGEESGDVLGSALMGALHRQAPHGVTFSGVGGWRMAAHGLHTQFPMDDLTAMGFGQVIGKLPTILKRMRETVEAILRQPPDVLVLVDAPDFTHRVAARVRKRNPKIPIVKYVSPTVWAWRAGRAKAMRPYTDRLMALLPFEPDVHARLGGPVTDYVGHPLLEQLSDLRPGPVEAERRAAAPPLVLVLPGSRRSELERLGAVFGAALGLAAQRQEMELVLPTLPRLKAKVEAMVADWPVKVRIITDPDEKHAAFRQARAALAASGTVTLELALAGVPTVAAYKVAAWEAKIAPYLLYIDTAILTNLVLGEKVVPEFIQHDCTPEKLAAMLGEVLADGPARTRQLEGFAKLDVVMGASDAPPSERAASVVLEAARPRA